MTKLFGTDGVRGRAGEFLTAQMAMRVAMASGIYFQEHSKTRKILVGKDTRKSGYMIENAVVSGLTAVGYDVIQIGPMPTPAVAFLTENMRCDAGIMISASHNTYDDNGIKFFDAHGNKLSLEIEKMIENIYADENKIAHAQQIGRKIGFSKRIDDVIGRYIVQLKNSFPTELSLQGIRVVLDTANGAGYRVGPTVLEELGAEVIVIHNRPNGDNINDMCGAMHTKDLQDKVKQYRADVGFALDGDADRLVIVDERSEVVDGDQLIGALALFLKSSKKLNNSDIVTTVMSNEGLDEFLTKNGMNLKRSDVGDKNVLELMLNCGSNFGGEQSGHVIMHEFAKTGDGLVTALQVLALMKSSQKKASEVLRPFSLYPQLQTNLTISKKTPLKEINGLSEIFKKIEQDAIRYLVRYSGTENKLRILLEGKDEKLMHLHLKELKKFLSRSLNE